MEQRRDRPVIRLRGGPGVPHDPRETRARVSRAEREEVDGHGCHLDGRRHRADRPDSALPLPRLSRLARRGVVLPLREALPVSEHDFVPIRGRRHLDGAADRPRRRRSRFDDDETPSRRATAAPCDDDAPPSGQRWSTWDTGERGPAPHPPWLVTELAAVDTDLGVLKTGKEADVHLLERALSLIHI